ncbi:MAG: tetratricopeptide repeat protein, partial [Thiotrichales bacterium]|nr:tetratricopeptide repeat protein [Thiotrichales bacterium]
AFLQQLLGAVTEQAQKRTIVSSTPIWQDHAWPFELAAFVLLVLAFYPIKLRSEVSSSVGVLAVGLISASLLGLPTPSQAQDDVASPSADLSASQQISKQQRAYQAFQSNEFDLSEQLYDGLNQYDGWFGAGDAAYRAADYESAVLYFTQAAVGGRNDQERAQALFNLGNTFFKSNLFPQAIEAYEQALVYQPDNQKAKHNLALAKQALKQQKKGKKKKQKGKGKGKGGLSRNDDGAMYGGQKPNNQPGKGVSGDSTEGDKQAKNFVLPTQEDRTNFELNQQETIQSMNDNSVGNAIIQQQKQRKTIEKFEQSMKRVQDNQSLLLQHLFEREEGFQAEQSKPHDIPGVKPW